MGRPHKRAVENGKYLVAAELALKEVGLRLGNSEVIVIASHQHGSDTHASSLQGTVERYERPMDPALDDATPSAGAARRDPA